MSFSPAGQVAATGVICCEGHRIHLPLWRLVAANYSGLGPLTVVRAARVMGEAMSTYDYLRHHPVVDQLLDTSKERRILVFTLPSQYRPWL